jgi:hypothetical protein
MKLWRQSSGVGDARNYLWLVDWLRAAARGTAPSKLFSNVSKEVWFQCQAFPKNPLVVLWDFKGLQ